VAETHRARPSLRPGTPVVDPHRSGDQVAALEVRVEVELESAPGAVGQVTKKLAVIAAEDSQPLGDGEDHLPVRDVFEQLLLGPPRPEELTLLMNWYEQIVGPELAQQISPTRSALDRGMIVTSHTDAPVALPNLIRVMSATVNRTSRSGKVMGPDERLTPLEALKAVTLWGAYSHFEEDRKGSIEVGKLADLVILSDNPLTLIGQTLSHFKLTAKLGEGGMGEVYRRRSASPPPTGAALSAAYSASPAVTLLVKPAPTTHVFAKGSSP
jgi:hypothetical protein